MKLRNAKIFLCFLFLSIFVAKVFVSVIPAFAGNNKTVSAVINPLDQESKGEKDNADKEPSKEKKFADENIADHRYHPLIFLSNSILHKRTSSLYIRAYHPTVPTPPPNA